MTKPIALSPLVAEALHSDVPGDVFALLDAMTPDEYAEYTAALRESR